MHLQHLKIYNGNIITPRSIVKNASILVTGNIITGISDSNIDIADAIEIDAKGKFISPGFIDIHVHGAGGYDFMDATEEAFLAIAATHARFGTTAMLPTTLTGSKEDILEVLSVYESANRENVNGAQFLGMHLEGPYLAMSQRGAQDPRYIRDPDEQEYKEIVVSSNNIKRWSAAPELKGAIKFGKYLVSKNILPAIAHTDAIYEEAKEAFDNGYTLATHFYSAMLGVTRRNAYRYAGVVEAGYLIDEMDVEIIADGVHLPVPLLQLVYKIKGVDRTALITDAMRATVMPEGESIIGSLKHGVKVIIEDGVAKLPDRSVFAGSVATADRLIRTILSANIPLTDAVTMMSLTPARILNCNDRKGSLEVGKDADIILFDDQINIDTTIVNGRVVYQKGR